MLANEYQVLFDHEADHWWFQGLHAAVIGLLRNVAGLGPDSRVLDAGCGTGMLLKRLKADFSPACCGFDLSRHAAEFWSRRNLEGVCRGSINAIPFADGTFDAAVSVDVLESAGVDERKAIRELVRVIRPGGVVLIVVPAYKWLLNPSHHRAVAAVRRYERAELKTLLSREPVEILRLTHLFATFLPAVAAYRLGQRLFRISGAKSDIGRLPGPLNKVLAAMALAEAGLIERIDLPFGSSIVGLWRKRASP